MSEKPTPTPEGELIRSALARTGMSARAAAKRAGISEGRWRQIVNGYQVVTKGTYVPVTEAPSETVAAMARAVGLTAAQLAAAGREDAARHMEQVSDADPQPAPATAWDEIITGPDGVVDADEVLMWRDTPTGRLYRLADAEDSRLHGEYEFPPGETPEQVIDDLRRMLGLHRTIIGELDSRMDRRRGVKR